MLTVRKVWVDDGIGRPDSVTVQLLRDGKVRDEVELSQSNNWVYTWDRLDDDYNWSVLEAEVPDGYEATYAPQRAIPRPLPIRKKMSQPTRLTQPIQLIRLTQLSLLTPLT